VLLWPLLLAGVTIAIVAGLGFVVFAVVGFRMVRNRRWRALQAAGAGGAVAGGAAAR
jgi:uncharacterized protein (DUF2062 family)